MNDEKIITPNGEEIAPETLANFEGNREEGK